MSSDEDDKKSVCSFECTYSDEIDSDVEVELYSMVHYESNLSASNLCTPLKSNMDDWNSSQQTENLFTMCESNLKSVRNDELTEVYETAIEDKIKLNAPFNSTINENEKLKSLISAKFRKGIESNVVLTPTSKQKSVNFNNFHSPIQHEELCQKQNSLKRHSEVLNSEKFQSQRKINRTRKSLNQSVTDGAAEVEKILTVPFINSTIYENETPKSFISAKFQKCIETNVSLSPTSKQKRAHLNNFHNPIQHEELCQKQNSFQSQRKINRTRESLNRPITNGETAAGVKRILTENEKSKSLIEKKLQKQCIESNSVPSSSCKKKKPHLKDFLSPIQHEKSCQKQSSKKRHFEELKSEKFLSQRKKNRNTDSSNEPILDTYSEINDSDSDDYIIIDDDSDSSHQTSEFVTNMNSAEKTNIFNIDSSSNDSLSSKVFNPTHGSSNVKISGKDPWHFAPLDAELQSRIKCRLIMRKAYKCRRCYQRGHPASFCPRSDGQRSCFVCYGQTKCISSCKKNMCRKCHKIGHDTKKCSLGEIICSRCGMIGHVPKGCPDLWRRFHLTTNISEFTTSQKLPQSSPIYCFNCGKKGHFGPNCEVLDLKKKTWKTWPAVISYNKKSVSPSERTKVTETDDGKKKASQKNASKILGKLKRKKEKIKENNTSVTPKAKSGETDFPRNKSSKKDFTRKSKLKRLMSYNPEEHKDGKMMNKKQIRFLDYLKKKGVSLKSHFSKKVKLFPGIDDDADF